MTKPSAREVTFLLKASNQGEQVALEKLMPLVYEELRRPAQRYTVGGLRHGEKG